MPISRPLLGVVFAQLALREPVSRPPFGFVSAQLVSQAVPFLGALVPQDVPFLAARSLKSPQ